jgi:hypothetical protein
MGKLNLDNIDRAVIQEYQSCRNDHLFEATAGAVGYPQSERIVQEHGVQVQPPANDCADTGKH